LTYRHIVRNGQRFLLQKELQFEQVTQVRTSLFLSINTLRQNIVKPQSFHLYTRVSTYVILNSFFLFLKKNIHSACP
jgi:hypothetical protein